MQNNLGWEDWMSKDCSSSQFDKTSHHPFFFFIYILRYATLLIFLYTQLMYHMKRTKIEEYNKLPGTPWRQDSWINVCCLLYQQWRRHHRNHHVRLEMESCGNTGLVYSPHCQEFVSRSTFRRHQLLWVERKRKHTTSSGSPDFDDDSADSDLAYMHGKHGLSLFFLLFFRFFVC